MMKSLYLLAVTTMALAGPGQPAEAADAPKWGTPYLEIGAYMHHTGWDSVVSDRSDDDGGEWRNPLGKVEVGWEFGGRLEGLSVQAVHFSSMQERDPGLNMVGIAWRW